MKGIAFTAPHSNVTHCVLDDHRCRRLDTREHDFDPDVEDGHGGDPGTYQEHQVGHLVGAVLLLDLVGQEAVEQALEPLPAQAQRHRASLETEKIWRLSHVNLGQGASTEMNTMYFFPSL